MPDEQNRLPDRDESGFEVSAGTIGQTELLTAQFYDWERRGRGWQIWPYPVDLEPPFSLFHFHYVPPGTLAYDDGRRPTLMSTIAEGLRQIVSGRRPQSPEPWLEGFDTEPPDPEPSAADEPLVDLRLSAPGTLRVPQESIERFLLGLPVDVGAMGFEISGTADAISVHLVVAASRARQVARLLGAYLPEATVNEDADSLRSHWGAAGDQPSVLVDFGLSREFMLPLRTFGSYDPDPLIAIAAALSDLNAPEIAVVQVLFQPVRHPWAASIMRSVLDDEGKSFFLDAPEFAKVAREKISHPLFAAVIRIGVKAAEPARVWEIARALGGALRTFSNPAGNELIPLANDGYDDLDHEEDLLLRQSHRSGMILNLEEVISFVHPPSASVRLEKLKREDRKTRVAPSIATGTGLVLGTNVHAGRTVEVALNPEQRSRHMYVIGASGTGKSTLLLNLIVQDMKSGQGLCVLDPHGDLIDRVLGYVPEERLDDVILLDPADPEYAVGFNILSAQSELEKTLLSSDLVAVFRRLSTSWGDQMTSILGNAILAFLESERGGTLMDLRRFLVERAFRDEFLRTVHDPDVVYYWQKEFPLLRGNPQASILTRLDTFLRPKLIRHMVAQKEDRLTFRRFMDEGKILLCRLSEGAIGEENAHLLGSLLVSKLQQIAMSRQDVTEAERRPFYLYLDEFHHFVTPTMEQILSGARKYKLGLILAHQDLGQVASKNPDVLKSALTNPCTRICFSVGDQDARTLAQGFASFEPQDLQNLGIGQAICRVERAEYDFNLDTPLAPPVDEDVARARRERIITQSRAKYATPRADVEAALRARAAESRGPRWEEPSETRESPRTAEAPSAPPPPEKSEQFRTRPTEARVEAPTPTPGRGGARHKYLQSLIQRWGEANQWGATIEERILGGLGSVDVALRKGHHSVACEIAMTTTPEHEIGNIEKCLLGGFQSVILVSPDTKTLAKIRDLAEASLSEDQRARVRFCTAEEALACLEGIDAEAATQTRTIRGRKVTVKFQPMKAGEKSAKRQAVSQVVARAMKRLKGEDKK